MELSVPRAFGELPPKKPTVPPDYIRPPAHRIDQLRRQMKSGLVQPLDKHEQFYVELHKHHVLSGRYEALPSILKPLDSMKALPSTGTLPPVEFPTFPAEQPRSNVRRPSILPASVSSTVLAVAAKAAQMLRAQCWIEELGDDLVDQVLAYSTPCLTSHLS
ncbi:hypothetical protein MPH_11378 [Macrophomina phaseolina MS6]|uniref:Uncharacterized protein n=1 Tax=Macrophomina phaseolina (strain MS6) TaxID=1126212 RepID=K2RMT2_MACPH|nr:hypothetical protein MPH_11378 [Macrophomina phaseolina MS6]